MTELEMIRAALAEAHELGRILALNPQLNDEYKTRSEKSVRTLLSLLYTRLNDVDVPQKKLDNFKSDY
jgi:hypothetical protein